MDYDKLKTTVEGIKMDDSMKERILQNCQNTNSNTISIETSTRRNTLKIALCACLSCILLLSGLLFYKGFIYNNNSSPDNPSGPVSIINATTDNGTSDDTKTPSPIPDNADKLSGIVVSVNMNTITFQTDEIDSLCSISPAMPLKYEIDITGITTMSNFTPKAGCEIEIWFDKNTKKTTRPVKITKIYAINCTQATVDYVQKAIDFIKANEHPDTIKTITNLNNPNYGTISSTSLTNMHYYHINDDFIKSDTYNQITFTTTDDEVLGPIILILDNKGTVFGSYYRD